MLDRKSFKKVIARWQLQETESSRKPRKDKAKRPSYVTFGLVEGHGTAGTTTLEGPPRERREVFTVEGTTAMAGAW
ncbi:hypothetical protein MAP00_005676 [Monascus purpureus]|nr:hypothetical protein MAP00_005676 [Monascus purpureus]